MFGGLSLGLHSTGKKEISRSFWTENKVMKTDYALEIYGINAIRADYNKSSAETCYGSTYYKGKLYKIFDNEIRVYDVRNNYTILAQNEDIGIEYSLNEFVTCAVDPSTDVLHLVYSISVKEEGEGRNGYKYNYFMKSYHPDNTVSTTRFYLDETHLSDDIDDVAPYHSIFFGHGKVMVGDASGQLMVLTYDTLTKVYTVNRRINLGVFYDFMRVGNKYYSPVLRGTAESEDNETLVLVCTNKTTTNFYMLDKYFSFSRLRVDINNNSSAYKTINHAKIVDNYSEEVLYMHTSTKYIAFYIQSMKSEWNSNAGAFIKSYKHRIDIYNHKLELLVSTLPTPESGYVFSETYVNPFTIVCGDDDEIYFAGALRNDSLADVSRRISNLALGKIIIKEDKQYEMYTNYLNASLITNLNKVYLLNHTRDAYGLTYMPDLKEAILVDRKGFHFETEMIYRIVQNP